VIYFRVAMQMNHSSLWQWKSTVLSTPGTLFDFLKIYDSIAKNRLRVFFATSMECMNEMLVKENRGFVSNSVAVDQFLKSGRKINIPDIKHLESELGLRTNKELVAKSVITGQLGYERSPSQATSSVEPANPVIPAAQWYNWERNLLGMLQEESEWGSGGDHDTPYTFALPQSMPQALAWTKLLAKVQRGELEP
jgi:hypothetical protein